MPPSLAQPFTFFPKKKGVCCGRGTRSQIITTKHWANGDQPVCTRERAVLAVQVTASTEGDGLVLLQELHFLLYPSGKKGIAIVTNATSDIFAILLICPLRLCSIPGQSAGFHWPCHLPSILFQTVKDAASTLPPIFIPPPSQTFILDESYFKSFLSQGTVLSGGKEKRKKETQWAVYAFDQKHSKCAQKQPSQKKKRTAA